MISHEGPANPAGTADVSYLEGRHASAEWATAAGLRGLAQALTRIVRW